MVTPSGYLCVTPEAARKPQTLRQFLSPDAEEEVSPLAGLKLLTNDTFSRNDLNFLNFF